MPFFISYRVQDSVHATALIAQRLATAFGWENVFRDRDSLPLGALYPQRIRRAVERSDAVLAVVGPSWLTASDGSGARKLDNPHDWVRCELRLASRLGIPIVPVLLDGASLPAVHELPADIAVLGVSTFWRVDHESFESDVRGLIDGLARMAAPAERAILPARPCPTCQV